MTTEANDVVKEDLTGIEDFNVSIDGDGNVVETEDTSADDTESADILRQSIEESYTPTAPKKKEESTEPTPFELASETFFTGNEDELDELVRDPKKFNDFINGVYKKAVEKGHNLAMENFLKSAPGVVKSQVSQQITMQNEVKKFYDENEDLVPYKQTVAAIATKIASENPQLPLAKLFKATEQAVRKRLNLMKEVNKHDDKNKPNFPRKPSGNRNKGENTLNGIDKELDDMAKALG